MGGLTFVLALTGPSMANKGWQLTLTSRLQHYAHNVVSTLGGLPGWVVGLVLAGALGGLVWIAIQQRTSDSADEALAETDTDLAETPPEVPVEPHPWESVTP